MHTFDTPAPVTAVLNIPAGRVQFIAADRATTTVQVEPANPAKARDTKAAEQTTVDYADGVLRVQAPASANQLLGPTGSLDITVRIPAGSHVQATAGAAELRAVGRLGDITADGADGTVKIDEAGALHLTAHRGDITVGRLNGPARITTHKGDITITEATAAAGTVELTTQMGDLSVTTAPGVSAGLDAGTTHGRVHNTLKNTGTPELTIRATTAHGDITARGL